MGVIMNTGGNIKMIHNGRSGEIEVYTFSRDSHFRGNNNLIIITYKLIYVIKFKKIIYT